MQSIPGWLSIGALVIVVLAFIYFYFRTMRKDLRDFWLDLNDLLRVRLDKIPNLLETVRILTEGKDEYISEFIKLRAEVWPMSKAGKKRVHAELEVSEMLGRAWGFSDEFNALKHDINYLSLRTEFKDIAREIEALAEEYNKKVRHYNRMVDFIILKPLLMLMRFKRLPIFEFES